MNLIHVSQPFMIYPGLSSLTCVLHKFPVTYCKEGHAGKMLKIRKHETFPTGFLQGCSFVNSRHQIIQIRFKH